MGFIRLLPEIGEFSFMHMYTFIYESVNTCSYEWQGEGEAHRSPWSSFKERALYLAMKFGKFRIWYLYGLYKIEKALPEGKVSQSLFSRQIFENKHKNRRRGGES